MKTNTTISIDGEVKNKMIKILNSKGTNLSAWFEMCCRKLLEERDEKEVNK